jgi:hypothetical protein
MSSLQYLYISQLYKRWVGHDTSFMLFYNTKTIRYYTYISYENNYIYYMYATLMTYGHRHFLCGKGEKILEKNSSFC